MTREEFFKSHPYPFSLPFMSTSYHFDLDNQTYFEISNDKDGIVFSANVIDEKIVIDVLNPNYYKAFNNLYEQTSLPIHIRLDNFDRTMLRNFKRDYDKSRIEGNYIIII